jgi:hypothetical protein
MEQACLPGRRDLAWNETKDAVLSLFFGVFSGPD